MLRVSACVPNSCPGSKCQKANICADLLIVFVISILIRRKMAEHKIGLF